MTRHFTPEDMEATAPLEKIGILATQNPDGLPHLTFINSLRAAGPDLMTLGQFIRGQSKHFVQQHPRSAFFILSPIKKRCWQGTMVWTRAMDQGPELEFYKSQPLQRYNSYFPIHRVHYFDLVSTRPAFGLPLAGIAVNTLKTQAFWTISPKGTGAGPLTPYGRHLLSSPLTLKFFSFMGQDGFPVLTPLLPCTMAGDQDLIFPAQALLDTGLEPGMPVAVFCLKTTMESILVRGCFTGPGRVLGMKAGRISIDWVYNSMPPNAGQIHPPVPLEAVTAFD